LLGVYAPTVTKKLSVSLCVFCHFTCGVASGTILFAAQTGVEYSINGTTQASPTFAGLAPGT
jgi:pyruvate/oxaloacetate carboxyltransferase